MIAALEFEVLIKHHDEYARNAAWRGALIAPDP